jgi:hypothetical protein
MSCRGAHSCYTDGLTVELRIYGLADVDLGGLGGDEAYEPRPLLEGTIIMIMIRSIESDDHQKMMGQRGRTVLIGAMLEYD